MNQAISGYKTVGGTGQAEWVVKRSRFLATVCPCESEEAALACVEAERERHPDATHHCWAFRLSPRTGAARFFDDGEPSGTAGRPILGVLERQEIWHAVAVVVRYYGGQPLGASNLARAYAAAAQMALDAAGVVELRWHACWACNVDYNHLGPVLQLVEDAGGRVLERTFAETVRLRVAVPAAQSERWSQAVADRLRGPDALRPDGEAFL